MGDVLMTARYFASCKPHAPDKLDHWWVLECFQDEPHAGTMASHQRNGKVKMYQRKTGEHGTWISHYERLRDNGQVLELTHDEANAVLKAGWPAWREQRELANMIEQGNAAIVFLPNPHAYGDHW